MEFGLIGNSDEKPRNWGSSIFRPQLDFMSFFGAIKRFGFYFNRQLYFFDFPHNRQLGNMLPIRRNSV